MFSSDNARIITADRYVSGWDVDTLGRIFRTRPLPDLRGLAFQPNGELMLSMHGTGHYALMESRTGAVVATCGDAHHFLTSGGSFALSACGRFVIECHRQLLQVREIATNAVVWSRHADLRRIEPLKHGEQWALFFERRIEVWSWPFAQAPVRAIAVPGFGYLVSASGTLVAYRWRNEIQVVDVADERPVFSVRHDDVVGFRWSDDGSLVVARRGHLDVYDRAGVLTGALDAPGLGAHGHAFGVSGDVAALCYTDGLVRVRGWRALLHSGTELPPPWIETEPRDDEHVSHALLLSAPDEQSIVDAETPEALEAALAEFREPAWVPVSRAERGPIDASKFGGVPWIAASEEWPCCGLCDSRMDLFLQLNSKDLPEDSPKLFEGLLQVFVCTHETYRAPCSVPHDSFAKWSCVRILVEPAGPVRYVDPPEEDLFEEEHIVGWVREDDFPDSGELELRGVTLGERARSMQIDRKFAFPRAGDKLLGWAKWEQGVEIVGCSRCGQPMRLLFQIDACQGVPVMLGDGGIGWVSQCEHHPDVVTFNWSCG